MAVMMVMAATMMTVLKQCNVIVGKMERWSCHPPPQVICNPDTKFDDDGGDDDDGVEAVQCDCWQNGAVVLSTTPTGYL